MKSQFNRLTIIAFVALATMITACNGGANENEAAIAVTLTQTAVSSAPSTESEEPTAVPLEATANMQGIRINYSEYRK